MEHAHVALQAYELGPCTLSPLTGGLINETLLVEAASGRYVLQRLHPIFAAEVNEDIEAVTAHLAAAGLATPRMVRTRAGGVWTTAPDGVWRVQTFVPGHTVQHVDAPALAEAAGAVVGRFHAALADLRRPFAARRVGVHDTARHLARLDEAIDAAREHAERDRVARLRDELRAGIVALPSLAEAPIAARVAHGDLKISNVRFDDDGGGLCLVDLDTLGELKLPHELGDAWRSWCNPLGEDDVHARFDLALLAAAWRGYHGAMGTTLLNEERALLVTGVLTICIELAARFARDVLEDAYFGWDATRFASRAAHNLVRAQGQAALYRSLEAQRTEAERIIAQP